MTMAGRATSRRRQHLIDVARMLGYCIVPSKSDLPPRYIQMTYEVHWNGEPLTVKWVQHNSIIGLVETNVPARFKHMWMAAKWAIERHDIDTRTLEPPRHDRALGSAAPEIFLRRNQSERTHHRTAKASAQRKRHGRATR